MFTSRFLTFCIATCVGCAAQKTNIETKAESPPLSNAQQLYNRGWARLNITPPEHTGAYELFSTACEGKVAEACWHRSQLLRSGLGIERNVADAFASMQKACEYKTAYCADLGLLYAEGVGTTLNEKAANDLFEKACDRGVVAACDHNDEFGCFNLAKNTADKAEAQTHYAKACRLGHNEACAAIIAKP